MVHNDIISNTQIRYINTTINPSFCNISILTTISQQITCIFPFFTHSPPLSLSTKYKDLPSTYTPQQTQSPSLKYGPIRAFLSMHWTHKLPGKRNLQDPQKYACRTALERRYFIGQTSFVSLVLIGLFTIRFFV